MEAQVPTPDPESEEQPEEETTDLSHLDALPDEQNKHDEAVQEVLVPPGNSQSVPQVSDELMSVQHGLTVKRLKRHGVIEAFQDWTGFVMGTGVGVGLTVSGVSELIYPDLLPVAYTEPMHLIGAGILLSGSRLIFSRVKRILDIYWKYKDS